LLRRVRGDRAEWRELEGWRVATIQACVILVKNSSLRRREMFIARNITKTKRRHGGAERNWTGTPLDTLRSSEWRRRLFAREL
jgi:hypothetical protein